MGVALANTQNFYRTFRKYCSLPKGELDFCFQRIILLSEFCLKIQNNILKTTILAPSIGNDLISENIQAFCFICGGFLFF